MATHIHVRAAMSEVLSETASQASSSASLVPPSFMSSFGMEHRVYSGQLLMGKMKES